MSALTAWILSILGVVVVGAVIDLVLPSGRMNKYIKSVFASVTVLIVLLPLPNLLHGGCDFHGFSLGGDLQLQEEYLDYASEIKKKALVDGLRAAMLSEGITLGEVEIEGNFRAAAPVIESVQINFSQVVIDGQSAHINKYQLIAEKVSQYLAVARDVVRFYE